MSEQSTPVIPGPVIVTGAASGIGAATARLLARRGVPIVVADLSGDGAAAVAAGIEAEGGVALGVPVDVADAASCEAVFVAARAAGLSPSGLVNSAGVTGSFAFADITPEQWDRIIGINLTGTMRMGQLLVRELAAAGRPGAVVNIASVMAHFAAPNLAPYAASKGGVRMLTQAMAVELAPQGIRVNAISPGYIQTGMTDVAFTIPRFRDAILSRTPMGEFGRAEDIASVAAFLLSDDARYLTGQTIPVDGGMTAGDFGLTSPTPEERLMAQG